MAMEIFATISGLTSEKQDIYLIIDLSNNILRAALRTVVQALLKAVIVLDNNNKKKKE